MNNYKTFILCTLFSSTPFSTAHTPDIFHDVRTGNKEAIKKRLENCEDCSEKDGNGNNALHVAVAEENAEIIDLLTTAPYYGEWSDWFYAFLYAPKLPKINEKNNDGETPLHCTINKNKQEITKLLLKKHANMEIVNKENLSALFAAIKKDASQFIPIFVAHTLDLNKHRREGETILHYAIKEKKPNTIQYCIQETTLINASNNKHQTPVLLAIDAENFDLLRLLYKGLNIPASNGVKPIHYATLNGKLNIVEYLLYNNIAIDEPDKDGNSSLFYAISHNNMRMVHYLLSHGANIQKRNHAGEDAFAIASRNKDPYIANYFAHMPGVDIDARDNNGQTSFMRASFCHDYEKMKQLIDLGVNVRIADNMRENVLHKIARDGDYEAAHIALNHDPLLLQDHNKDGLTPLCIAIQQRATNHDLIALFLKQKANIHAEDNNGLTALHHASAYDNVDAIIMLHNHGASSEKRAKNGNTVAHSAAEKGSIRALRYLQDYQPHLLRMRNNNNETPLLSAIKNGHRQAVKLLLCNADFVNKDVKKAIELANTYHHYDLAKFLQQKHNDRINECQDIVALETETRNLIAENNSLFNFIYQKNSHLTYIPTSLTHYSKDQLYDMSQSERNTIKKMHLEDKQRELNAKAIFLQAVNNIHLKADKEQKQENERDAIAQVQGLVEQPSPQEMQQHVVQFQGKDVVISLPADQVYPPQEEEEEQEAISKECCICFEEQLTIAIPCKNKHTDFICKGCLARLKNCPLCRAELQK